MVNEIFLDCEIELLSLFGAEVADWAIYKLETGFYGVAADDLEIVAAVETFDMAVCAEFEIYFIRIIDHGLCGIGTDKLGKRTADLITQRELSVGKGACAGKTGRYAAARFAVYAYLCLCLRAAALIDRQTFFDHDNVIGTTCFYQFKRGKYTCGTCTDD